MSISLYSASVPVFRQMLDSLCALLAKAETHAGAKNIEPAALLQARLFPDMFALTRQVQIAADFARGVPARLAGMEVPVMDDKQESFADLQSLLSKSIAFLDSIDAAKIDGQEAREIVLRPGTPKERKFAGQAYLLAYGLPQFFFHVTTAYALLRHNGVEVGKKDFMGKY
ncbi:MAG: DUF1993 domain-containing protein [Betaproteobacteria bacterium]